MKEDLIKARIASRIMDDLAVKQILKETTEDCGGDETKAKRMIVAVANEAKP